MPSDMCDLDEEEIECAPRVGVKTQMLGKWALLLTNQQRFVQDIYRGDTPIVNESVLTWIDIPLRPTHQVYSVKETELSREDSIFMSIASVTEIEEKAFQIEKTDSINYAYKPNARLELTLNMNRDVVAIQRQVYNLFMLLGNVGGLFSLFVSLFRTILGFTNYQKSDNLLAFDLFKTRPHVLEGQKDKSTAEQ